MNKLKKLITIFHNSNLIKFHLENEKIDLKINKESRSITNCTFPYYETSTISQEQATSALISSSSNTNNNSIEPGIPSDKISKIQHTKDILGSYIEVKSPMAGIFYESSSPGEQPFVQLGTNVSFNQTLCIIEAMKLMNEIEAETNGEIIEILVKNGELVEYDQTLMKIRAF